MNEYSPKTWLAVEIFAVIFVLIMSRSCSDKSSKFNSFSCTLVVSDFHILVRQPNPDIWPNLAFGHYSLFFD